MESKHWGVDALGVVGLVVGLWLVAPDARIVGRDTAFSILGWAMLGVAGLLLFTSVLTIPTGADGDQSGTDVSSTTTDSGQSAVRPSIPGYSLPTGQTGADGPG